MLKILLVDDEAIERTGIRFLIHKYQIPLSVAEAVNGKEAIEYIKSHNVDILLTDVKMPYMDGLELAKEVFQYDASIKIVIFSSYGEFEFAKKALEANAVTYLLKPIDVDEFVELMHNLIMECEELQLSLQKEKDREETGQKQLLYQLLTGTRFQANTASIDIKDLLPGKWLSLIHLETRNGIFVEKEDEVLQLLRTYIPVDFTYVNIYPNDAFLILRSKTRLSEEVLSGFTQKLCNALQQVFNESSTILIGPCFKEHGEISKQAALLHRVRTDIFKGDSGILFAEKLMVGSNYYEEEMEECRKSIVNAISRRDMGETSLMIQRLITILHKVKALSLVYLHHVFYDLISRLYLTAGIGDNALIHMRIEQVVQCAGQEELSALFAEIMKEVAHNEQCLDGEGIAFHVKRVIELEYNKDISLEYIAEKVHLSPAYLSYLYKQETGHNIIKQLTDYRMEKAKELLQDKHKKIVEVAKACGYANPSYFNRMFKNLYGITPTQYREKL